MEYKPRCSKTRRVHFQRCAPDVKKESECPDLARSIHARGEGGVGGDSHARRQDDDQQGDGGRHDHRVGGVTKNKNMDVRSLISVWEDMDTGGGGGLDAVFLSVPEGAGSGRRMSQEFESLRGKFEKLGEGETSGPGCELTNCLKQENIHIQTSFSTLCMGRNKQRARAGIILERQKLFSIFTAKTVRGGMPLVKTPANRKRGERGVQDNSVSASNPAKKMKV